MRDAQRPEKEPGNQTQLGDDAGRTTSREGAGQSDPARRVSRQPVAVDGTGPGRERLTVECAVTVSVVGVPPTVDALSTPSTDSHLVLVLGAASQVECPGYCTSRQWRTRAATQRDDDAGCAVPRGGVAQSDPAWTTMRDA
jgi:hypothetical protein